MSALTDKQALFTDMVALLIHWLAQQRDENGDRLYRVRWGDAYRDPRAPYGHPRSLHRKRLAVDLILDKWDGESWVYQRSTAAYKPLGAFWEGLGGTWGGRFNDGNHFSLEHGGMK